MKIMCIDAKLLDGGDHAYLKYGEVYLASGDCKNATGQDCYIIPELPLSTNPILKTINPLPMYLKKRFIPISDIDEAEMERNYNELLTTK